MSIEAQLFSYLTSDSTLAALIGDRLYPLLIPVDEEHPAIAYQMMDRDEEETHKGPAGTIWKDFQFSIQDKSYPGVLTVEEAVITAMQAWKGTAGDYKVTRCMCTMAVDGYNLGGDIFTRRVRFEIQYK